MAQINAFFQRERQSGKIGQINPSSTSVNTPDDGLVLSFSPWAIQYNGTYYLLFQQSSQTKNLKYLTSSDGITWNENSQVNNATIVTSPSAVVANNLLWVFYQGPGNSLRYTCLDGSAWGNETIQNLGGISVDSAPGVGKITDSTFVVTFQSGNSLCYLYYNGSQFSQPILIDNVAATGSTNSGTARSTPRPWNPLYNGDTKGQPIIIMDNETTYTSYYYFVESNPNVLYSPEKSMLQIFFKYQQNIGLVSLPVFNNVPSPQEPQYEQLPYALTDDSPFALYDENNQLTILFQGQSSGELWQMVYDGNQWNQRQFGQQLGNIMSISPCGLVF